MICLFKEIKCKRLRSCIEKCCSFFIILESKFAVMIKIYFFAISFLFGNSLIAQIIKMNTDVLVVGGSTGGAAAGIQSARSGARTIIVEQTNWLGGMITAAGVSCTDGNNDLPSGIWEEFRQALYTHYQTTNLFSGWVSETCFEPHVGDSIFKAWAFQEKRLQVKYGWYFDKVIKKGNRVTGASFINNKGGQLEVSAVITIDGTDLGDVFANAGAKYDLGTEDPSQSGEKIAPGKSAVIQDLTWAATLQDFGKGADKTIPKPMGYNATKYYCSTNEAPCKDKPYAANTQKVLDYGKLTVTKGSPKKYMLNWPAHGNDDYLDVVEMKPIERELKYLQSKNQTLGFIYFLQTELRQKQIGMAADEMDKGMALMPYNREGRRLRGMVRLNIDHIKSPYQYHLFRTGISVGDYPVDHHHAQYPGKVPPIPFPQVPSFNIPLGALIPEEIEGLIVCEKGISVSNIANGTTRLQPVVLLTGQAAGILAAKSFTKEGVRNVKVREVQNELLNNKCFLMPFVDVNVKDPAWEIIQKFGIMGIFKGVGKSKGWANKTYFYPDSLVNYEELKTGIQMVDGVFNYRKENHFKNVTLEDLLNIYNFYDARTASKYGFAAKLVNNLPAMVSKYGMVKRDKKELLTKRETAVYLSYLLDFLYSTPIDLFGEFSN